MKNIKKLVIASRNKGKIKEIADIFSGSGFTLLISDDLPEFPDVEETGSTFYENSLIKAKALVDKYGYAALADDSGLEVDYLRGEPGVFSSRYGGEEGNDRKNIEKLLNKLLDVPEKLRGAQFRCLALYLQPDGQEKTAEGIIRGSIILTPRGHMGFGYDPVFMPEGYQKTMAELELVEKNKISHRGKAFNKLLEKLKRGQ